MAILFAQYWDVVENKEKEYEMFILGKYIPTYEKTGLRLVGAYYVVVGAGPRIIGVSTTEDLLVFQKAVTSEEYSDLLEELFPLVRNYSSKLYKSYGPITVDRYEMQLGVWKFNQYFNILGRRLGFDVRHAGLTASMGELGSWQVSRLAGNR